MTWTYDQPTGTPPEWPTVKDHVRFLLGDRVQAAWSPSDEEVEVAVSAWNAAYPAYVDHPQGIAATIAVAIADWFGTSGITSESKSVGNSSLSKSYGDRRKAWRSLASRLAGACPVSIPGATMSGMGLASSPQPERLFTIGQFDNGGARGADARTALNLHR